MHTLAPPLGFPNYDQEAPKPFGRHIQVTSSFPLDLTGPGLVMVREPDTYLPKSSSLAPRPGGEVGAY